MARQPVNVTGPPVRTTPSVVETTGGYPLLAAVETLPVGSCKVPHLPVLPDVVGATDAVAVMRALVEHRPTFKAFAATLQREGFGSMAATVREALDAAARNVEVLEGRRLCPRGADPERLTSALRSLLEWTYAATFKTAGASTMTFAPWYVPVAGSGTQSPAGGAVAGSDAGPSRSAAAAPGRGDARPSLGRAGEAVERVVVPPELLARVAAANAVMYERAVGLVNEAHGALPPDRPSAAVIARAVESARAGRSPSFVRPTDHKTVLKIDYKVGEDALVMVDLNAGTIGAHFDDRLLDALPGGDVPADRLAARQAEAVLAVYEAARGRPPARVVVSVLDERMFELWYEADLRGLVGRLRAAAAARGRVLADVPVVTMAGLYEYAAALDDAAAACLPLNGAPWPGRPDLVVAYSWGTTHADRAAYARLAAAGVLAVDGPQHSFLAAKELAVGELLLPRHVEGVVVPPTHELGTVDELLAGGDVCAEAWRLAEAHGWEALAMKMQKLRRPGGKGDFASAFIYPATPVGRLVAGRLAAVFAEVSAAGGGSLLLTASPVRTGGGLVDADGLRRDVEIRTYAFPVLA